MKLMDIIKEEVVNNIANKVYNRVISAVLVIYGTNKTEFLSAINTLRNKEDFQAFTNLFKDKRTGYSSFYEMVNKEFDRFDYNTIQELRKKLLSIGVDTTFRTSQNNAGILFFGGNFTLEADSSSSNVKPCNRFAELLPNAVKYWRDWLSAPITKKKFKENWGFNPLMNVDSIFNQYLNALNGLKIYYYNKNNNPHNGSLNAFAFVDPEYPSYIYVNCDANDPDPLGTLVHEIQHTLYDIKPLNPDKKIGSVFVNEKTIKDKIIDFFGNMSISTKKTPTINFNKLNQTTGIAINTLQYWHDAAVNYKNKNSDGDYLCRETEKMSNIMSIRRYFNLKPEQGLTYQMLKSEMDKKRVHTDVYWIIMCWALNGFQDINKLLGKINDLAYQQTGSNSTSNLA